MFIVFVRSGIKVRCIIWFCWILGVWFFQIDLSFWFCDVEMLIFLQVCQKGKVGCIIDFKKCESYIGLRCMLVFFFNFEGLLDDFIKGWQLVYMDYENDVFFVGDDFWE